MKLHGIYVRPEEARRRDWSAVSGCGGRAWASITMARRPTSSLASTTRSQEYARDVVYHIAKHLRRSRAWRIRPSSPRAAARLPLTTALLVFNVLGVSRLSAKKSCRYRWLPNDSEQALIDLQLKLCVNPSPFEAICWRPITMPSRRWIRRLNLFSLGYLPLGTKVAVSLKTCLLGHLPEDPEAWRKRAGLFSRKSWKALDGMLSDTYFCNFSLFQSMPDSWAVKQLYSPSCPFTVWMKDADQTRRCWATSVAIRTARWTSSSIAAM